VKNLKSKTVILAVLVYHLLLGVGAFEASKNIEESERNVAHYKARHAEAAGLFIQCKASYFELYDVANQIAANSTLCEMK
jgi:hypothetical protein